MDTTKDTTMQHVTDVTIVLEAAAEFIAGLLERIEQLESDLATAEQDGRQKQARIDRLEEEEKERDVLKAKIERMERQEPVAWTTKLALRHGANALGFDACAGNLWGEKGVPLYALPSAQPAPSINEGVRKVTLDFRWESEAQHHIPTIEIEFDPVSPDSPNDAKGWQDRDRIASMLSPEAKP